MVKIRLSRGGRKNAPHYRIIVTEARTKRDGKFIEILGQYSPIEPKIFQIDQNRYNYWLEHGAQPTERILTLVNGLNKDKKTTKTKVSKSKEE